MNKSYITLLSSLALIAVGATGCKKDNPLKNYVEETVKLKSASQVSPSQIVVSGSLEFRHTHYWTAYRTECDTEICGYDSQYVCHPETHCEPDHDDGNGGGYHGGGGGGDHDHDGDDHHGGGGGAHYPPGGGWGGGPHPHIMASANDVVAGACYTHDECGYENVPRYCQVNCREVPYTESNTTKIESPVTVRVSSQDGGALNPAAIQSLQIGVKPNEKFAAAFANPSLRPKNYGYLFDSLNASDRTLVILAGNGLRLANSTSILALPAGFKAGDAASFDIQVVRGGGKNEVSAIGTTVDFPALETSDTDGQ